MTREWISFQCGDKSVHFKGNSIWIICIQSETPIFIQEKWSTLTVGWTGRYFRFAMKYSKIYTLWWISEESNNSVSDEGANKLWIWFSNFVRMKTRFSVIPLILLYHAVKFHLYISSQSSKEHSLKPFAWLMFDEHPNTFIFIKITVHILFALHSISFHWFCGALKVLWFYSTDFATAFIPCLWRVWSYKSGKKYIYCVPLFFDEHFILWTTKQKKSVYYTFNSK